jgi:hypothetical protein
MQRTTPTRTPPARKKRLHTQLIRKAAEIFGWDEHRKRFAPPVHNAPFPKLEEDKTAEAKFHKRFRSKTGFLANVAVQTRPDVLEHAERAARRLNDPVPECEKYSGWMKICRFFFQQWTSSWCSIARRIRSPHC